MSIQYRYLSEDDFAETHATMLEAFADYHLDMSYMTPQRSWLRNIKSGVDNECSVGAFDGGKMVGFTFVGLDEWLGETAAFDAATGIIPAYRGRGVAKSMFGFILPRLKARGVSLFLLEVLQPNKAAIRAYEKSGFQISRAFACYDLQPDKFRCRAPREHGLQVRVIDKSEVRAFVKETSWQPSWENSFSGMDRIPDDLIRLGAFDADQCVGILVFYPLLEWLMSLVVTAGHRRRGVASLLLNALMVDLPGRVNKVKITNIDHSDTGMKKFIESAGAKWVIDQFEMEYRLDQGSD